MCSLLIYALCTLLAITVESKEVVSMRGKSRIAMESVQVKCDHNFVEYFRAVPNQEAIYSFKVVKMAPNFSFHFVLRSITAQKVVYKINYSNGCQFLKNPVMNKLLSFSYRAVLLNNTFNCPIMPGAYFLKNIATPNVIPSFHPVGHFQITARVQVANNPGPFAVEITWKYNITHVK